MLSCTQLDSHFLFSSGLLYPFVPDRTHCVYLIIVEDLQKNYIKDITISPLIVFNQQFLLLYLGRYFPCFLFFVFPLFSLKLNNYLVIIFNLLVQVPHLTLLTREK